MTLFREVADKLDEYPLSKLPLRNSNYMKELYYRFYAADKLLRGVRTAIRDAKTELPPNSATYYFNRLVLDHTRFMKWIDNSLMLDYYPGTVEEIAEITNTFTFVRLGLKQIEDEIAAIPMDVRSRSFKAAAIIEAVTATKRHTDLAHEVLMNMQNDMLAEVNDVAKIA